MEPHKIQLEIILLSNQNKLPEWLTSLNKVRS